jgi:ribosomal subunit interface protein
MKVSTTARHCELDPEIRLFAQQRMERMLRYFRAPHDTMEAHIVVAAEKYRHSAEITFKLRRGEVVAREEADGPRAAIELAAERLEVQIRRLKEKRLDRKRNGRGDKTMVTEPAAATDGEFLDDDEWTPEAGNGDARGSSPPEA